MPFSFFLPPERNSEIAHLNRSFLASDQKRAELLDEKDVWEERLDKVSQPIVVVLFCVACITPKHHAMDSHYCTYPYFSMLRTFISFSLICQRVFSMIVL